MAVYTPSTTTDSSPTSPSNASQLSPEQRGYRPQGTYLQALYDRSPIVGLCGPAGTGKSRLFLEKAHLLCEKYPGARILFSRKTRESMSESVLFTFEQHVVPPSHPILASDTQRRFRQNYIYPTNPSSQIVVVGLDNPQKVMSQEYDIIYLQEATEADEDDVQMLSTRLRNGVVPYQQMLMDFNPSYPHHWINRAIKSSKIKCYNTIHEDNPILFREGPVALWSPAAQRTFYSFADVKTDANKQTQAQPQPRPKSTSLVPDIATHLKVAANAANITSAPETLTSPSSFDPTLHNTESEDNAQVQQLSALDPSQIYATLRRTFQPIMDGATPTQDFPHVAIDGRVGAWTKIGEEYIATLNRLTGPRLLRLRFGLWAGAEGMVYADAWNEQLNLIDPFEIPSSWQHVWAIDFGFTNPFVWQDWAIDDDGRMYLVQEIYMTQTMIEDHARLIMQITGWYKDAVLGTVQSHYDHNNSSNIIGHRSPAPRAIVCDHDAEGRATLEREFGWQTTPAFKSVGDGIEATAQRMRPAKDGKPRLFIFKNSLIQIDHTLEGKHLPTCTPQEIDGYVWDPKAKEKQKKDTPLKQNDHGCDTMRYAVCNVDGLKGEYKASDVSMLGDVVGSVVAIPNKSRQKDTGFGYSTQWHPGRT